MFNPEKRVVMACDLCGGELKCIDFCPEEALALVAENVDPKKMWLSSIEKLVLLMLSTGDLAKSALMKIYAFFAQLAS
jgi:hypothetical protein